MRYNLKNVLVWLVVVVLLVLLWQLFYNIREANVEERDFTTFYQDLTAKKIKFVKITGQDLEGKDTSNRKFKTVIPPEGSYNIAKDLRDNGVAVTFGKSNSQSFMYVFLASWLHFILLIGILIILILVLIFLIIKLLKLIKKSLRN